MSIDLKKYRDKGYMKYASPDTQTLIRKMQNDARDSPYLSSDLKDFILLEFKHYNLSDLPEIIENTIRFFQKGDYEEMYEILKTYYTN